MLYFKLVNIIHMHILTDSYHTLQSKSNFVATFLFSTMNTIERKKKEAERKRKARLLESDEQIRIRLQAEADRSRQYRTALTLEKRKRTQEDNADRSRKYRYDTYYHTVSYTHLTLPTNREV